MFADIFQIPRPYIYTECECSSVDQTFCIWGETCKRPKNSNSDIGLEREDENGVSQNFSSTVQLPELR